MCEAAQGISSTADSVTPVLTLQRSQNKGDAGESLLSICHLHCNPSTPSEASQLGLLLSRSLLQSGVEVEESSLEAVHMA